MSGLAALVEDAVDQQPQPASSPLSPLPNPTQVDARTPAGRVVRPRKSLDEVVDRLSAVLG